METTLREQDNMGTDSGFKDDFILDCESARFGTDANFNNGETWQLMLTGKDAATGEEETWSCPVSGKDDKGWFSEDGGRTLKHEKPAKKPNANSWYGILIGRIVGKPGKPAEIPSLLPDMQKAFPGGVDQRVAAIWQGRRYRIQRQEFKFGINKETKEPILVERNMITEYHGPLNSVPSVVGGVPIPPSVPLAAPVPLASAPDHGQSAQATSTPAPGPASNGSATSGALTGRASLPMPVQAKLMVLAKTKTADEFMMGALSEPDVLNSPTLQGAAMNGSLLAEFLA